jgi:hypothetical protein
VFAESDRFRDVGHGELVSKGRSKGRGMTASVYIYLVSILAIYGNYTIFSTPLPEPKPVRGRLHPPV